MGFLLEVFNYITYISLSSTRPSLGLCGITDTLRGSSCYFHKALNYVLYVFVQIVSRPHHAILVPTLVVVMILSVPAVPG